MILKKFESLPAKMQNDDVKKYYDILKNKKSSLVLKRIADIIFSLLFIIIFSPVYIIIYLSVVISSGFPAIYKQNRITANCKEFKVYKFRSMIKNADKKGSLVTVGEDKRITTVGKFLRKYRLDELPQAFNVLNGTMTLVGTRPEVKRYVDEYTNEMYATLLLPAGVTSSASIMFKDEAELLSGSEDPDKVYIEEILPQKMEHNLKYLEQFNFANDVKLLFKTVSAVMK